MASATPQPISERSQGREAVEYLLRRGRIKKSRIRVPRRRTSGVNQSPPTFYLRRSS